MVIEIIIYILLGFGVIFALPSTVYLFMFFGVFFRRQSLLLESADLKNTQYEPYTERLKTDILYAKQLAFEEITLTATDGITLYGRYYKGKSDKLVILSHGYHASGFNNFAAILKDLLERGYNVLMIDQRGHGNSGGHFTTLGCKEQDDLQLWIAYADEKNEIQDVLIYGISMGSTTVGLASDKIVSKKVKGLIMEAGFTCFYDELQWSLGTGSIKKMALSCIHLYSKAFLKTDIRQSTEETLARNTLPVLFLHGDNDLEVPIEFTERNYHSCASKKEFIKVKGAGHTLCYIAGDASVRAAILEFIDECTNNRK